MSTDAQNYVIALPPQPALAVAGTAKLFPVRRLWCVGRNYVEHIKEMGPLSQRHVRIRIFSRLRPAPTISARSIPCSWR